jgi:hypothetical protein
VFQIGSRVTLAGTGAYEGASCVVDTIDSETVHYVVLSRAAAVTGTTEERIAALEPLCEAFIAFGHPAWNLVGPKGAIPTTKAGMLTVPTGLMLHLVLLWTETYDAG